MCHCIDHGVNWVIDNNSVFACVMFVVDCTFVFCIETCCVIFWSTTTGVAGIVVLSLSCCVGILVGIIGLYYYVLQSISF